MEEQKEIINYIKESFSKGLSKEEIFKNLLLQGKKVEEIQKAFKLFEVALKKPKEKEESYKKIIQIIAILGAISIGVGIFSFIAANWKEMGRVLKLLIILTGMTFSYLLGWILKEKKHYQKTGEALFLLGGIIYGGGIFLVGQMFHLPVNWPNGFALWMIGVIPMAFVLNSFPLFYLLIPLGFISLIDGARTLIRVVDVKEFYSTSLSLPLTLIACILSFLLGWYFRNKRSEEIKNYF